MATKFTFTQGDTLPHILLALSDAKTGKPLDLSEAGTRVLMDIRRLGQADIKQTLTLTKLAGTVTDRAPCDGMQVVTFGAPYEAPGSGGRVSAQWGPTSHDTPGEFRGQLRVLFANGQKITWREKLRWSVKKLGA